MRHIPILLYAASALSASAGCSSSNGPSDDGVNTGPAGGLVAGPADDHCSGKPTTQVDPAACTTPAANTGEGGASGDDMEPGESAGGAASCNQIHDAQYGDTLSNSEGDDDDCKYHASWTSTPVRLNQAVTFTITATNKSTGDPLAALLDGKLPLTRLDVYEPCDDHAGPTQNLKPNIAMTGPGQFSAGPIAFDRAGRWVVRFHLYEQCYDGPSSPHGHIAFFVDVP